jgi:flagellar protein FlaI
MANRRGKTSIVTSEQQPEPIAQAPPQAKKENDSYPSIRAYIKGRNRLLELYPVRPPHVYSTITFDQESHQIKYTAVEPTLSEKDAQSLKIIQDHLRTTLNTPLEQLGNRDKAIAVMKKGTEEAAKLHKLTLDPAVSEIILYYLIRDYLDYGKLDVMMKDPMIEDVSCNGPKIPLYVWHRKYESIPTNIHYDNDEELDSFIIRLAYKGKRMISVATPLLDASLPDGSRAQLTYGRYATKQGSTYTIRKFKEDPLTIIDLIKNGTISAEMAALFWYLIENKISVFVCGGVASGKTTMLNGLSIFITPDAKIVTIEDTPEVQLYHENWIRSVTRPATASSAGIELFDLLKASMRQRPDYILVGEIRGAEAYTLFQAMSTGHLGLATLHAESANSALRRLETEPMNIPRMMIASLNMIVIMARREINGSPTRRIISCDEVNGLDSEGEIIHKTLFQWDPKEDKWYMPSESYYVKKAAIAKGITVEDAQNDIKTRTDLLTFMVNQDKRTFTDVSQFIRDYAKTPGIVNGSIRGNERR